MMENDHPFQLNIQQVLRFLPHRAPFLLVDRVLEIHPVGDYKKEALTAEVGTRVVALKNITYNEPFFQGHFPQYAIVPGVLLVEMMAQTASFSVYPGLMHNLGRISREFQCILVGVDGARFRKPVVPGDTLRIETEVIKCRGKLWCFKCYITVEGEKVAEAEILANLIRNSATAEGSEE